MLCHVFRLQCELAQPKLAHNLPKPINMKASQSTLREKFKNKISVAYGDGNHHVSTSLRSLFLELIKMASLGFICSILIWLDEQGALII